MAFGTNFYVDLRFCGTCHECVTAVTGYGCLIVLRMDSFSHFFHLSLKLKICMGSIDGYCRCARAPCCYNVFSSAAACHYRQLNYCNTGYPAMQVFLKEFDFLYHVYKFQIVSRLGKHIQDLVNRLIRLQRIERLAHDVDRLKFLRTE